MVWTCRSAVHMHIQLPLLAAQLPPPLLLQMHLIAEGFSYCPRWSGDLQGQARSDWMRVGPRRGMAELVGHVTLPSGLKSSDSSAARFTLEVEMRCGDCWEERYGFQTKPPDGKSRNLCHGDQAR